MRTIGKPIPAVIAERAGTSYNVDENGCWVTTYRKLESGYGVLSHVAEGGKPQVYLAHRASWTHHRGEIPKGLTIDHMCFNRSCVNPDHLRLLTLMENTRRRWGRDFPIGQCQYGHPNSQMKTFHFPGGDRFMCEQCHKDRNTRGAARRAAELRLEYAFGMRLTRQQKAMLAEFAPELVGSTPEGQKDA